MKKLKSLLPIALCMFVLFACSGKTENQTQNALWENALYQEDTELGEGSKTVYTAVEAGDKSITFTLHTDAETLADVLTEHGLLAGEEGIYGLYVKQVNGIEADYDKDQSYWALYEGDAYANVGIDAIQIADNAQYKLVYEK